METLIKELIDGQNLSFIGSIDEEGFPVMRAMLRPRLREGIKTIYFSTNNPTAKVRQLRENPKSCVYFCDEKNFRSLLLVGEMEVLDKPEEKRLVWRKGDEIYYPGGVNSDEYVALRFATRRAQIYENFAKAEIPLF